MSIVEELRAAKARPVKTPEERIAKWKDAYIAANRGAPSQIKGYSNGWYRIGFDRYRATQLDAVTTTLFDRAIAAAESSPPVGEG